MQTIGCCSFAQWCLILHNLMDCRSPVLHHFPEFAQNHVIWVGDTIQPSHPLSSPSLPGFSPSQHQGHFKWISSSHQVTKVLELPIQPQSFQWIFTVDFLWNDWSDVLVYHRILKCLLQHHNFKTSILGAQPPLWYNSHMPTWLLLKTVTLTIWALYFLW